MTAVSFIGDLHILPGAVNTGVLVDGGAAVLFDCCDTVTPERLREIGVDRVEMILCTQHRRPNTAGARRFVEQGAELVVPGAERSLVERPGHYWNDPANRWHIYHHQPGPQVPAQGTPVARGVGEGDTITWHGREISVLDTPGATDGSVSYVVDAGDQVVCFAGDAIHAPGMLWDFSSLQKGHDGICDYHGFMGNRQKLIPSLRKLQQAGANILVPSHGEPMENPSGAVDATLRMLDEVHRNYVAISCLNNYFPSLFSDLADDPLRMPRAATHEPPDVIVGHVSTSFVLRSDTGAALLVDAGTPDVTETVRAWISDGRISGVDLCWVTHYHDDHVDHLHEVPGELGCPIGTIDHMVEVIEHPERFWLPCISPNAAPVAELRSDGESWQWHEYTLTAFHFPGQTFYHSGLLVEGQGMKLFFAGDSGSPTGIDDHCCPNRNFLGEGRGFRRCIEIWREHNPDFIFNQHQPLAFSFTDDELDYMDEMLAKREKMFAAALPWPHPDIGTDENWARCYPYEQSAKPGDSITIDVQFTNHADAPIDARVEPVLPDGWTSDLDASVFGITAPPRTVGIVADFVENPDVAASARIDIAANADEGLHVIPFRVWWDGRYLGQFRNGLVRVS